MRHARLTTWLAPLIAIGVFLAGFPAWTQVGSPAASIAGTIRQAPAGAPLAGARLLVAERASGRVSRSEHTTGAGAFSLRGLVPGTYDLAVEVDPAVYPLEVPVELAPDSTRVLRIDVSPAASGDPQPPPPAGERSPKGGHGLRNSPFAASMIVLGAAVVVDLLVANATDETLASPTD